MNIINSPETRVKEINAVSNAISHCQSIEEAEIINLAIDELERRQPNEITVITNMRSDLALIVEELNNHVKQTN
jgi:hypothetical protein